MKLARRCVPCLALAVNLGWSLPAVVQAAGDSASLIVISTGGVAAATPPVASAARADLGSAPGSWLTLAPPDSVTLAAGRGGVLTLAASVPLGFHVQAHKSLKGLITTRVRGLKSTPQVSFGSPVYPAGHPMQFAGEDQVMTVYEGRFSIGVPVRVAPQAKSGRYDFAGSLAFQACDDKACFPPRAVPFTFSVFVTK